jgi:hypothetical protein
MEKNEIEDLVDGLGPRVERLKSLYEQYFMGLEKIPPAVLRKDVDRTLWRLRRERFNNTRLRFRFQQVLQRYNTYQQYWKRVLREMERGTYRRSLMRAAKKFDKDAMRAVAGKAGVAAVERVQKDLPEDEAPTPPRGMPTPSRLRPPDAGGHEARAIYDKLVAAKREAGGAGSDVDYERLRKSLDRQRQQLQQKHGSDKRIDFEVIERGGKAMIRPVVRKK